MPHLYNDFIDKVAREFDHALSAIEAEHNFDLGPEFEIALCKTLRRILPHRFGVCRGFLVNKDGELAGDDIVIYDRALFPTARFLGGDNFAQKEQVPIEAVAAYIEAKHTLTISGDGATSLGHAMAQAGRAKSLCWQRAAVPLNEIARNATLGEGFHMHPPPYWPDRRNPPYTAVMARRVRLNDGEVPTDDPQAIDQAFTGRGVRDGEIPPDLVVGGMSSITLPVVVHGKDDRRVESPFILPTPHQAALATLIAPGIAFGIGLCALLWALDYIVLGTMPWAAILQDALGIPSSPQTATVQAQGGAVERHGGAALPAGRRS